MNKFKLFIENFVIYGFGGVIAKIIPLIMVPIITYIIPETAYYGVSDLSHTLSNVGCSLATMGMYDAMYRMFFEKDEIEFKKSICSTTLLFTFSTSIIVSLLMITTKEWLAEVFFGGSEYEYLVYITAMATLVGATNNIISAPTRMQNKRKIYIHSGLSDGYTRDLLTC